MLWLISFVQLFVIGTRQWNFALCRLKSWLFAGYGRRVHRRTSTCTSAVHRECRPQCGGTDLNSKPFPRITWCLRTIFRWTARKNLEWSGLKATSSVWMALNHVGLGFPLLPKSSCFNIECESSTADAFNRNARLIRNACSSSPPHWVSHVLI